MGIKKKCEMCGKEYNNYPPHLVQCKCEKLLCSICKIPENHSCSFDYKKNQQEILEKKLIKCQQSKLNSI